MSSPAFSPISRELLDRYLAGQASAVEAAQVAAWLSQSPEQATVVSALQAWPVPIIDVEAQLARIKDLPVTRRRKSLFRPGWRRWGKATAGVIAAVVLAFMVLNTQRTNTPRATTRQYRTVEGQRADIPIAPTAHALLGPATILTVTQEASGGIAIVLSGEALFTVVHHPRTPFTVRTGSTTTRVLGTTFFVRRYVGDRVTRVGVIEGRVGVHAAVLSTNSVAVVSDSGPVTVTPNVAIDDYTAWSKGELVFRSAPVRDVITELSRAYGVDIRVPDPTLRTELISLTIPTARWSLDEALALLVAPLEAHYSRAGSVITIAPGKGTPKASSRTPIVFHSESQYGK